MILEPEKSNTRAVFEVNEGYKTWLSPRRPNLDAMRFSDGLAGGVNSNHAGSFGNYGPLERLLLGRAVRPKRLTVFRTKQRFVIIRAF